MQFNFLLLIAIAFGCLVQSSSGFFTTIPEGYRGIHSHLGAIQPNLKTGLTFYNPVTDAVSPVKVIQDEDVVTEVHCTTKEGVPVVASRIEIANRINPDDLIQTVKDYGLRYDDTLVKDPLAQKWREICAELTVDELDITRFKDLDDMLKQEIQSQINAKQIGITVEWVRITGIRIPKEITAKRLEMAGEKAQLAYVEERNKRVAVEKDHEKKMAIETLEIDRIKAESVEEIRIRASNTANEIARKTAEIENEIRRKSAETENEIRRKAATTENDILLLSGEAQAQNLRKTGEALGGGAHMSAYYDYLGRQAMAEGGQVVYYGDRLPGVVGGNFFPATVPEKK